MLEQKASGAGLIRPRARYVGPTPILEAAPLVAAAE